MDPTRLQRLREALGFSQRELATEFGVAHGAIGLPVFWGIASVALTAVPVIFGEQWLPAVFPLGVAFT